MTVVVGRLPVGLDHLVFRPCCPVHCQIWDLCPYLDNSMTRRIAPTASARLRCVCRTRVELGDRSAATSRRGAAVCVRPLPVAAIQSRPPFAALASPLPRRVPAHAPTARRRLVLLGKAQPLL